MIQKIINDLTEFINKYLMKSGDEYLELRYGISVIIINFFKISSIIIVAFLLGIHKYVAIYFISFAAIRMFAFGGHARNGSLCTIINFIVFIGGTYLCLFIKFDNYDVITIFLINIFILYRYAPAATKKRPIVSRKMIIKCKLNSIVVASILMLLSIIIKSGIYRELMSLAAFTGCIFTIPVTYKLLGEEYLKSERVHM